MSSVWASLTLFERHELMMQSRRNQALRKQHDLEKMKELEKLQQDLIRKVEEEAEHIPCLKMSAAALPMEALDEFEQNCKSPHFAKRMTSMQSRKAAF
eukprot:11038756-Lingulodinium_polyedra.AAC.1